ncbi:unnamed protein product [Urochloa decumbens]|uniref:Uncharacterized protein n=1 Tax=Urochloa decumbens TaxID=240449 RepID=A0ABC9DPV6_9POAL
MEKSTNSTEHAVIKACKARIKSNPNPASGAGVVMEVYQFKGSLNEAYNAGYLYQPTNTRRITFPKTKTHDQKINARGREVKLWTKDLQAQNDQLSKVVLGCTKFNLTLQDWIHNYGTTAIPHGDYLSGQGKDIVRSGWTAVDHIWEKGYTCRDLDKVSSYVMDGGDIKILPFVIDLQLPENKDEQHKLVLRSQFADMLDKHIGPLWGDPEFSELTKMMRDQHASTKAVLGHPVLSSTSERQIMYRNADSSKAISGHAKVLKKRVIISAGWVQNAKNADKALANFFKNGYYTADVTGALRFGRKVSCHYAENYVAVNPKTWNRVSKDRADRLLKHVLPLVLCQWYRVTNCMESYTSDLEDGSGTK